MAYWNLHERQLTPDTDGAYRVNGNAPLCFFHFSGIVVSDPAVLSKHTDRFTLAERPDLQELFATYKTAVLLNGKSPGEAIPYGFDTFSDGTVVTRLARRIYAAHQQQWVGQDPFDAAGTFAAFAKRHGLIAGKVAPQKATWKEFNSEDRRVEMVHRGLRFALRILGPNRYELLMRYLAHIAVLRHQSVFLKD
jgi:hypothetical protein